jgi:hypothetical protein
MFETNSNTAVVNSVIVEAKEIRVQICPNQLMAHKEESQMIQGMEAEDNLNDQMVSARFNRLIQAVRWDISRVTMHINQTVWAQLSEHDKSKNWKESQGMFVTSRTRQLLLGRIMPYLCMLWLTNIAGSSWVLPDLTKGKSKPQNMLTMQKERVQDRRFSYYRTSQWSRLLLTILLNVRPGGKRYYRRLRMAGLEELEFEAESTVEEDLPVESEYNRHVENTADDPWKYISGRTKRVMYGMYELELKLRKIGLGTTSQRMKWSTLYRVAWYIRYMRRHNVGGW